jgi:two-component system, LuxR family, sensor kinase FixL
MHNVTISPPVLTEILDSAPACVLVVAEDGRIVYANAALARLFGYEAGALLHMQVEALLPARYRGTHEMFRAGFFGAPRPRVMGEGRALFALHAAGHEFPIEIGLGSIMRQGAHCVIAFVNDLSRRLAVEEQFAGIVQALPFGLLLVAADGHITMTNPALEKMFGYSTGALLGQPMEILLPARIRPAHPGLRDGFFASPTVRRMGEGRDLLARHKDGREFPVEIALTPIESATGPQVLAAVTDISLRKKTEAALLQMNAQLEEFTYIASHDLRSPLRGIGDLLGWIREDLGEVQLSDAVRNNFDRAALRVARAEQMIEDLLEYARAGQADGRIVRIEPQRFIEDTLALLPVPDGFSIELACSAAPFYCAVTPFALVLRNLVSNAFNHHGGKTGRVRVTLREDGHFNILTVEDDGAGIPAGSEQRIFKLFQRSTTQTPGHGVGLAVTRRVTNANGGTIVLNRDGQLGGACFQVHWPRYPNKEQE